MQKRRPVRGGVRGDSQTKLGSEVRYRTDWSGSEPGETLDRDWVEGFDPNVSVVIDRNYEVTVSEQCPVDRKNIFQ